MHLVEYSEYDVRDVTLMLVRLRSSVSRADWASIPKVVGSIPTVPGIFFKLARCGYTLRDRVTSCNNR